MALRSKTVVAMRSITEYSTVHTHYKGLSLHSVTLLLICYKRIINMQNGCPAPGAWTHKPVYYFVRQMHSKKK